MQETMLKILKNIRNSLLILIVLTVNVEAKNSKDVSNIKVQKHISQTKIFFAISR